MKLNLLLCASALCLFVGCDSGGDDHFVMDAGTPDAASDASLVDVIRVDAADPVFEADPAYSGPTADVEVIRDNLGIPHIYGETDADAFYGAGYMQATDRLFQMEMTKYRALGRRAEIFGEGSVHDDTIMRIIRNPMWGKATSAQLRQNHPQDFALILAWVAGVNKRIDEVRAGSASLPYGFGPSELNFMPEHWTTADALSVMRMIVFGNASQLEYDALATLLHRFAPELEYVPFLMPLDPTHIIPSEERPESPRPSWNTGTSANAAAADLPPNAQQKIAEMVAWMERLREHGSNNWAVDGAHTENGRSLLAGDPHQGLDSPSLIWAHHMNSAEHGGTLDVAGFGFVGTPGVQLGHNDRIGWTATNTYPDIMDLFGVQTGPGYAMLGGEAREIVERVEQITVRGETTPRQVIVEEVPGYGMFLPNDLFPLPLAEGARRVLLNYTGFAARFDALAFLGFMRARNIEDFEAAVDMSETACFNFIGADADDIAYRTHVLLPDRGPSATRGAPWRLRDADDPNMLWTRGFVPSAQMPHSRGGVQGYLASANNEPYGFTDDGSIENDPIYFGVWFDPGLRASRIEHELARLTARGNVSVDDMKTLQHDAYANFAPYVLPMLDEAFAAIATDEALASYRDDAELQMLHDMFNAWDRQIVRTSSEAVAFSAFVHFLAKNTISDDYVLFFDAIYGADIIWTIKVAMLALTDAFPNAGMLVQGGRNAVLLDALADTRAWLNTRFGGVASSNYVWGTYHGVNMNAGHWGERFNQGWINVDGGDATINVSNARFFDGPNVRERRDAGSGSIYRMVVSFADDGTPEAQFNFPPGNVEDPDSPYFDNGLENWVEGRYSRLPFRRSEVEGAMAETLTLSVE